MKKLLFLVGIMQKQEVAKLFDIKSSNISLWLALGRVPKKHKDRLSDLYILNGGVSDVTTKRKA